MGFFSFNERYYRTRLAELENSPLSAEGVYEAKQLLKVLDDLTDEGYTSLNRAMEADFSCLTRLRRLIRNAGDAPFPIVHGEIANAADSGQEYELTALAERLIADAGSAGLRADNPFLDEVVRYAEWIGFEENTAYVFLFRDAFLSYAYYAGRNRGRIHAWLVSRRFIADLTHASDVDDDIRFPIFDALEAGLEAFEPFFAYCRAEILKVLDAHAELKAALRSLLGSIKEERILAVETGYCGTIPLMLKSMDDRVDFRMYTTAPYLFNTYRNRIFTRRYEDIRRFETLYSQDLYMRYASYRDGHFYVRVSEDSDVKNRALAEVARFLA